MAIEDQIDDRIVGLLDLVSCSIGTMYSQGQSGRLETYLKRLQELGTGDDAVSTVIQSRVIDHRVDIAFEMSSFEEAARLAKRGMTLTSVHDQQYHLFAVSLARSLFNLGEIQEGYDTIANAILMGVNAGVNRGLIVDHLRAATLADPEAAPNVDALKCALAGFATRYCGMNDDSFAEMWRHGPRHTVTALLAAEEPRAGN